MAEFYQSDELEREGTGRRTEKDGLARIPPTFDENLLIPVVRVSHFFGVAPAEVTRLGAFPLQSGNQFLGSATFWRFSLAHQIPAIPKCNRQAGLDRSARRLEAERHPIDTVAEAGRRRPVFEHVAEVSAASAAVDLSARHAVASVDRRANRSLERGEKARPAGAALELAACSEKRLTAADTGECAGALFLQQGARSGRLRPVAAQHRILLRRQRAAPFFVSFFDWIFHTVTFNHDGHESLEQRRDRRGSCQIKHEDLGAIHPLNG
jgi:hypothetical protein